MNASEFTVIKVNERPHDNPSLRFPAARRSLACQCMVHPAQVPRRCLGCSSIGTACAWQTTSAQGSVPALVPLHLLRRRLCCCCWPTACNVGLFAWLLLLQGGNRTVLREQVRQAFRKNQYETDSQKIAEQKEA